MWSGGGSGNSRRLLVPLSLFLVVGCQLGQGTEEALEARQEALTSADVLGFDALNQWTVVQGSVQSLTLTDTHTKGAKALAVAKPSGFTRLDSVKLPSTNAELAKIDRGVSAVVDFMIPAQQANTFWPGAVQMYVSSASRNLSNAYLGQVELTGMRTGVYTTLSFAMPDAAADALKGKAYNDLVFGIVINVPLNSPGTYRLDNLRIRGKLPPTPQDQTQIQQGESILLEPWKQYTPAASKVAEQSFSQGVIQIPQSFHPIKGRAGAGSATFAYRVGTGSLITCQYPAESTGTNYVFGSCAGGALAGDLVPADFVRLTVVNGDPSQGKTRIKAQIALNPVGDELVSGLPPIPTFFGTNAAEVGASITAFVQAARTWQSPPGKVLIRLPSPDNPPHDSVIRNGILLPPARPPADNDPPFAIGGRLTNNDLADAGWHVNGSLAAPLDGTGARATEFHVDAGADAWLLGGKFQIMRVTGDVKTNTPPPTPGSVPPSTGSAKFCYEVFGLAGDCAGPYDGSAGLNQHLFKIDPKIPLPGLNIGVFSVTSFIDFSLNADLTGGFTPSGFEVAVNPSASLNATLRGGVSVLGFLGGGLFVNAKILAITAPISASVNAALDPTPGSCKITISETLSAQAHIEAGSGRLGWYLEGGLCCGCAFELCWRTDGDFFHWDAYDQTFDIVPAEPLATQIIPLDVPTFCPPLVGIPGDVQYPITDETFKQGDKSFMNAQFLVNIPGQPEQIVLDKQTWTSDNPTDLIIGSAIMYGTAGPRRLSVVATKSDNPGIGNGTASVDVNVTANDLAVAPSAYIVAPLFGTQFGCTDLDRTINASATASDPNGGTTTFKWYFVNPATQDPYTPLGNPVGSGAIASFLAPQGGGIRVIVSDPDGNQGLMEIPTTFLCIK